MSRYGKAIEKPTYRTQTYKEHIAVQQGYSLSMSTEEIELTPLLPTWKECGCHLGGLHYQLRAAAGPASLALADSEGLLEGMLPDAGDLRHSQKYHLQFASL